MYLTGTRLGPIDGEVKKLADQITKGKTTIYEKARAIYDWTCNNMFRDPDTKGCGSGDVCSLLKTQGGKCTDIHSVFVSLCRAAGVPAREVFGIRQGKKAEQDITKWQHCWAEFYLPGYDWVPVDPADVRKKMLKENLTLEAAKTKEYREYFWGAWDQYRVKLAVGRDLILNPPQQGSPINTFGYPYAQIGNKTLDWLAPDTFSYTFTYQHQK
jgi:transglutaminase-like putative cysteine protease